jgi:hypothetical protein
MTPGQQAAVHDAGQTEDALLAAQEHLYAALRRPQPMRERRWAAAVGEELAGAIEALQRHRQEVEGPGGLYEELANQAPWLLGRVKQLGAQLRRLEDESVDLQIEVARIEAGDLQGLPRMRSDAEHMLFTLRDLLHKEIDLIYEQFNQPAALD